MNMTKYSRNFDHVQRWIDFTQIVEIVNIPVAYNLISRLKRRLKYQFYFFSNEIKRT